MSYYSYNYDNSYLSENYQTPSGGNYDIVSFQAFGDGSSHEFSNQSFFKYDPTPYYGAYEPHMNGSSVSYSVSSFSEPKSIVFDPYNSDGYSRAVTQLRISYSVQEFNEPEFEEYDPTPYGGGYDLALTYGNPLPPSEVTCYPRSSPDLSAPALPPKVSVEEPVPKPHIESKPTPTIEDKRPQATNGDDKQSKEKSLGLIQAEDSRDEGNGYEYEKRVPQIPSGYGLEAMDICESIFGYWPCLDRYNKERHDCGEVTGEEKGCNQWKETAADYLFGSSYPYGHGGISSYEDPICNYQMPYREQYPERQAEYDEDSWIHKFKIF